MNRWILAWLALPALMVSSAQAALQSPNSLLGGLTAYKLNDYENLYDSGGNIVTNRLAQAGDSLQGVFIITSVSNQFGTAVYTPQLASSGSPGAVELTGVFDEYVQGIDAAGNYILTPDTTSVVGSKVISGSAFQSTYGTGSMISVFYNNIQAMPIGLNGNGIAGKTAAQAFSLATTNAGNGTLWATFGAKGTWGSSPSGYFWAANQTAPGVATFAASLGFINNATGIPSSMFLPITQAPPSGFGATDTALFGIPNVFIIQGTTNPSNQQLNGTPYTIFSTDPVQVDFAPEPTSVIAMGGLFGLWALALAAYRRMRKA